MHGIVDEKINVFSFGVFLLEIISSRKSVDGSHQSLHTRAKPILKQGEIEKLIDPKLGGTYDVTQMKRLAFAASLCIRSLTKWRLTITKYNFTRAQPFPSLSPHPVNSTGHLLNLLQRTAHLSSFSFDPLPIHKPFLVAVLGFNFFLSISFCCCPWEYKLVKNPARLLHDCGSIHHRVSQQGRSDDSLPPSSSLSSVHLCFSVQ